MRLADWLKTWHEPRPLPEERVRILVLSMPLEDRFLLERLARQNDWGLRFTNSPRDAFDLASQSHFELILCDCSEPGYPWREVIDRLAACSAQSCILLVSPVTGDYLWREVLQHGGYDILLRPLCEQPTLQAVQAVLRFISPASGVSEGCPG